MVLFHGDRSLFTSCLTGCLTEEIAERDKEEVEFEKRSR